MNWTALSRPISGLWLAGKTRRAVILVLALGLCLALSWTPAQAQGGLRLVDTGVETAFPLELRFTISAASDVAITDIRLHYSVDRRAFADVTAEAYLEFTPARAVDTSWEWDMRRTGGLPPGTVVEYWWTVEDAGGDRIETSPARVQFDDERFAWRSLAEGQVTIHWYEGTESFAEDTMKAVQGSLDWLAEDTGAHLVDPVEIYVYGSAEDLRSSMVFPQEWTGGVAFTRYGRIAIGIAPNNLGWGRKALAHELTHLVVHQMTLNPYGGLPTWLEEGLAMRSEGPLAPEFRSYLERAVEVGSLISARSLSSPFSAFAEESYLSYAESYSLVEFLVRTYGKEKLLELLEAFRRGSSYDGALTGVYGFDTDGLDRLWREHLMAQAETVGEGVAVGDARW